MDNGAGFEGETAMKAQGHCCPSCVQRSGACQGKPMRYQGEMWNISDCEFCMCQKGNIKCRNLGCPKVQCAQGQIHVHPVGKCCAECINPPICRHGNQTFQDGSTWDADACRVCTCKEGQIRCYFQICPLCPVGQARLILVQGPCCGHCQPAQCGVPCRTCLPLDPDNCTGCQQIVRHVQSGQCIDGSRLGFHLVVNNKCLVCDKSSEKCTHGGEHHCSSCPPATMLKEGQCVQHCGPGYYAKPHQCVACDVTCSTCAGPGPAQCLSCARAGQAVLQGTCLDKCPSGHYVVNGQCTACPSQCVTCGGKGPGDVRCTACQAHASLQDGACLPTCPNGHYTDRHSRCQSQSGP